MTANNISHAITRDGSARIICINSTDIVNKMIELHKPSKTMGALLGRSLTAVSIMGFMLKNSNDTITLQINCDGPAKKIICCSDSKGNCRGYVENPYIELPPRSNGTLDIAAAVGSGTLYVIKDESLKQPYIGTSKIISGEIAEDLTNYYANSEQIPTVFNLGVWLSQENKCLGAGGFILQLLPFADEGIIPTLEKNVSNIHSVSELIKKGNTPKDIINMVFNGIEYDLFDDAFSEYKCNCSYDRYLLSILSLSDKDQKEILDDNSDVEIKCEFCNKRYIIKRDVLLERINNKKGNN